MAWPSASSATVASSPTRAGISPPTRKRWPSSPPLPRPSGSAHEKHASPSPRASPTALRTPSTRGEGRGGRLEAPTVLLAAPHPNPLPIEEWGEGIAEHAAMTRKQRRAVFIVLSIGVL